MRPLRSKALFVAPLVALLAQGIVACGDDDAGPSVTLTVRLPAGTVVDPHKVRFEPASAVRSAVARNGELALVADGRAERLTVRAPGVCPVTFSRTTGAVLEARPWFDLGPDRGQIGYDKPFSIDVAVGCPEAQAKKAHLEWKQVEGPPLLEWRVDADGLRVHARTRPFADVHEETSRWGIVPVSPRTQGRYALEASWRVDGATVARSVVVTSIARATGVPSLAVGQRVMLAGDGWHVRLSPPGARARVGSDERSPRATFEADVAGHWILEDGSGAVLGLRAGRYDGTPLGCGTSECHHDEDVSSADNAMTHALERQLSLPDATRPDVSCMLDCHVVGERGIHDGGFLDRATEQRWSGADRPSWQELPRTLRRLGSVGCTGCHGPGAIPERTASRAVLRVDVCATCHDDPPRYTHVAEWQASRMARSDVAPATRATFACARCHTTSKFLAAQGSHGMRFPDDDDLHAEPAGIGCAACHASHELHMARQGAARALLRNVPLPDELEADGGAERYGASAVCIACHAPVPGEKVPSASAAAIWAGRVAIALPSAAGAPSPAPHGQVPCVACHGGEVKTDHSFRADHGSCTRCHAGGAPPEDRADEHGRTVRQRALALWAELRVRLELPAEGAGPAHASSLEAAMTTASGSSPALARALYEVALVVEDPAAGVHNAPFARQMLDDAEATLHATSPATPPR